MKLSGVLSPKQIIKLGMDSRQIAARFEAERRAIAMMDPGIARPPSAA